MTEDIPKIWEFVPWLPYQIEADDFLASCRLVNSEDVFSAFEHGKMNSIVTPVLEMTLDGFELDCFRLEFYLVVSRRMREALALTEQDVQFIPIDLSRSNSHARAQDYEIMNVIRNEEVSFPAHVSRGDLGSLLFGSDSIDVRRTVERRLFRDTRYMSSLFCTDGLALDVLNANCSGARFFDPRYQYNNLRQPMRFRTLRGIEEEGDWDPVGRIEHTRLIEAL